LQCFAADAPATQPIIVPASIEAFEQTDLVAKASGYIAEVKADIGDHVKQGDLLAKIAAPELDNDVAEAKAMHAAKQRGVAAADANVAQAKESLAVSRKQLDAENAALKLQEITWKREQQLAAGKAVTDQDVDEARGKFEIAQATAGVAEAKVSAAAAEVKAAQANRDAAAAQVDVAAAQLEKAKTLLAYTKITAPFAGVITKRAVNRGDLVQMTKPVALFVLQRIDTVRVFCDIPENSASRVTTNTPASIKLYGGGPAIEGKVTRTALSLNPETRTMRAEIDLPNADEKLLPGMYAQVTLSPGK
jgi:multidrug resistance efflux pump